MIQTYYEQVAIVDTSAVIALHDPQERYHADVRSYYVTNTQDLVWAAVDLTSHECFTTVRYSKGFQPALEHYNFLRATGIKLIRFQPEDETQTLALLTKYSDHKLSFHDAACAAIMKRVGIFRILTLDGDFMPFGFEILPGPIR